MADGWHFNTYGLSQDCWHFLSFFLSFLFGVAHAPFACQRWGLPHREGTSVVLCDTIRLTWWCVVCSCCATSSYREVCRAKGGISSGETLCHDIYPARPITTVSLATNTYCMINGHSLCAPGTVGPRVQFSGACEQTYSRRPSVFISGSSSD